MPETLNCGCPANGLGHASWCTRVAPPRSEATGGEPTTAYWKCPNCGPIEPRDVTYEETHDERRGGCGDAVEFVPSPASERKEFAHIAHAFGFGNGEYVAPAPSASSSEAGEQVRAWRRAAMEAMRYLNAEQIAAVANASGLQAHICASAPVRAPAASGEDDYAECVRLLTFWQKTHREWAEHFEQHPEIEAAMVATGQWDGAAEQRRIEAQHGLVLRVLSSQSSEIAALREERERIDRALAATNVAGIFDVFRDPADAITQFNLWATERNDDANRAESHLASLRERVEAMRGAAVELAAFARTAPGRLPQRVQDALSVVDATPTPPMAP